MLIAQITDLHVKTPGKLAYGRVDTARFMADCIESLLALKAVPDVVLVTGDLVDFGEPEEYRHLRTFIDRLPMPIYLVPGNHDGRDTLRAAFPDHPYLPETGFLHWVVEKYPVRLIGLDTLVPGESRGELCADRLAWLEATLSASDRPTLIAMHHPPFETGIGHMDRIGLTGAEAFARLLERFPQVCRVICGHLHRPITMLMGRAVVSTCSSPAHQVALDLRPDADSHFTMEPPGFDLHRWTGRGFLSHRAAIGAYPGPFPFFDPSGALID